MPNKRKVVAATGEKEKRIEYEFNHALIKEAFNTLILEKSRRPTSAEVAKHTNLCEATVKSHLQNLKFEPLKHPLRILTDEVLEAIVQSAKAGNSGSQKLWLQVMEGHSDKEGARSSGEPEIDYLGLNKEVRNKLKEVNVLELVIARVSYKAGVPSHYILSKLRESFYAKHTGILGRNTNFNEQVEYPSSLAYDFDEIRGNAKEKRDKDIEDRKDVEPLSKERSKKVNKLREALLKKIKDKGAEKKQSDKKSSKAITSRATKKKISVSKKKKSGK